MGAESHYIWEAHTYSTTYFTELYNNILLILKSYDERSISYIRTYNEQTLGSPMDVLLTVIHRLLHFLPLFALLCDLGFAVVSSLTL